ncbi:MAG TPA: alpha/beta hydrolase-fold protein [Solirubrobacteraceae bacterium]|nr:alpha/beta hydrolase-fold protein [Solirubrobacteraceae bacterium]
MSRVERTSRTQLWLEGLGDWSWPGRGAAAEVLPPAWVPARPPRLEPAAALAGAGSWAESAPQRRRGRLWLILGLVALAALVPVLAIPHLGERLGLVGPAAEVVSPTAVELPPTMLAPLPALIPVHADPGGSVIEHARFHSASLGSEGSFFAYLPAGYQVSARRYPVLYLLHGRDGHAEAFLEMGIQASLDGLISKRVVEPMIVVMLQDAPGLNNWRDLGTRHSETYVVEVQELVDRMLRTIPARYGRAIAGSSMGGFGAMNVALSNPLRFAVVESWLGFFDNLHEPLRDDRAVISRLGLHAFLYGASEDPVAVPSEDPEFAAELREAGARARGVIYPGGHSLEKIREHLDYGLRYAGRALVAARHQADRDAERGSAASRPHRSGTGSRTA